jgi:hypothetical protein
MSNADWFYLAYDRIQPSQCDSKPSIYNKFGDIC